MLKKVKVRNKSVTTVLIKTILTVSIFINIAACGNTKQLTHNDNIVTTQEVKKDTQIPLSNIKTKEIISIELGEKWLYIKGKSTPDNNWKKLDFNDSNWLTGKTGLGYGDGDDMTVLQDMHKNYSTVYARKSFNYNETLNINNLMLDMYYDDGFIAYLNGEEVVRTNMPEGTVSHKTRASRSHESNKLATFDITKYLHLLSNGLNVLAIEIHNSSITSSDLSLNPRLIFNKTSSKKKKPEYITKIAPTKKRKRKHKKNHFCGDKKSCGTLGGYTVKTPISLLPYVTDDLSGITYVAKSDTFFMINNGLSYVWEVDTSYNLLRKIKITGFGDSEDIVYLGNNNEFAIVNEDSKVYIGKILPETMSLNSKDFQEITFDAYQGNEGTEGITFDITTQTFYIVKEHHPRKLYSFVRPVEKENTRVIPTIPFDIQSIPQPRLTQDLSAITYNPSTGRLLILSDIDYRVIDVDLNGAVYGVLQLPERRQPEGLTLDANHNLHIVGEPNNHTIYTNPN